MTQEAKEIKNAAWRAALDASQNNRTVASRLSIEAQLKVIRKILSETMPGGEAEFWRRVEEELKS